MSHPMKSLISRLAIHGDFWLRYLDLGVRICPWYLEPVILSSFSVFFYITCVPTRKAVLANMKVLFPDDSFWQRHWRVYRVIQDFGWSLGDSANVRCGNEIIDWEIEGLEHLDGLAAEPGGALVLTAHMGSYDLAGQLFAARLKRPLHIVRVPERNAKSQSYVAADRDMDPAGHFVVHYNQPGNMLAVELTKLLNEGELVAIQGDRVLFDVAPQTTPFSPGFEWRLPKGPFLLGAVSRKPVYPIFIARVGWRRYRVSANEPFRWPDGRVDRLALQEMMTRWWSSELKEAILRNWHQWFVFESVFTAVNTESGGPNR